MQRDATDQRLLGRLTQQFFELADDLPVKVEFLLREDQAELLLQLVRAAAVDVVYARSPASFALLDKG